MAKKRWIAWLVTAAVLQPFGGVRMAQASVQAGGTGKAVIGDLSEYASGEVLAVYADGSLEVFSCADGEAVKEKIKDLSADPAVSLIQPNYEYESQAIGANDPSSKEQWALYNDGTFELDRETNRYPVYGDPFGSPAGPGEWDGNLVGFLVQTEKWKAQAGIDIRAAGAWAKYGGGKRDAIVALVDTGIDYTHEDLQGSLWMNPGELPGNGIDDDGNGYVDDVYGWNFYHNSNQVFTGMQDSHGTHGAGTICANAGNGIGIAGIVPNGRVKVMAVKALGGRDGGGSTASLIRAIRYAEGNGAVICNLSLTTTKFDQALYQAIGASRMLFVVAAGNGDRLGRAVNTDESPCYPASYDLDNIISVANLSFDGELQESSNYGLLSVDLAAPGTQILSTTPGSSYGYMTGTSMAAPMVAGAAAMVYTYYETIGAADVKEILLKTVTPLDSLAGRTVTGGMLNLEAALSFDVSTLSGMDFANSGHAPENGNVPYIESQIVDLRSRMYLMVRVVDVDGDLETLCYAEGEHTAEEFAAGLESVAFIVSENDTAVFQIEDEETGVYTFYARDRRGNEAVRTIKFAPQSMGPGGRQE